jgi:hypothetical protein
MNHDFYINRCDINFQTCGKSPQYHVLNLHGIALDIGK